MARELKPIDISNMPDLLRLAAEVEATKQPVVLRRDSQELATINPVRKPKASTRARPAGKDSPLWEIVGIGKSRGPRDVSENKHKYLAEAYRHF
jgi:hypothetical protein